MGFRVADILIEMFEVQLGAAIFIQFKTPDGLVNVLSDAGVKASGYDVDRVHKRLLKILDETGTRRLDLVVGTHYDEDHLNGLVPIIDDVSIEIGEAWMPPIANEADLHAYDSSLTQSALLPIQLYEDESGECLRKYLDFNRSEIQRVKEVLDPPEIHGTSSRAHRDEIDEGHDGSMAFFREHLLHISGHDDCDHGTDHETEADDFLDEITARGRFTPLRYPALPNIESFQNRYFSSSKIDQGIAEAQKRSLAYLRNSAAKNAINAAALNEVVKALRRRQITLRCQIIEDGQPRKYSWDRISRRFVVRQLVRGEPSLTLLGPSRALVRKHWNKLPIEAAIKLSLFYVMPLKSITPSNQLSYVMRLEYKDQGILVTGDAGMVDFKPSSRGDYYQGLLSALLPLHVVQVAHHGGNNAHFYRVLDAAKYPEQTANSYLLLSHATDDKYRPSLEFRDFLLNGRAFGEDITLLFTSTPDPMKVVDYRDAVHPVVGPSAKEGDVRLIFENGTWRVAAHAVAV